MLNYKTPLTREESDFAAEHHGLVISFLKTNHLPRNEFYDTVIFGYLRAVRKFLARPELHEYAFSTIAFRAMSCDLHHSREYWTRAKRKANIVSLQEDVDLGELRDYSTEAVETAVELQGCLDRLTPMQRRIGMLRENGYHDRDIARVCGISCFQLDAEMEDAKRRVLGHYEETAALAA